MERGSMVRPTEWIKLMSILTHPLVLRMIQYSDRPGDARNAPGRGTT